MDHRQIREGGSPTEGSPITPDISLPELQASNLDRSASDRVPEAVITSPSIHGRDAAVASLSLGVAACGGGGESSTASGASAALPVQSVRKPQNDAEAARFLLQASFSASSGSIEQLRSEGFEPWLDRQMQSANEQNAREFLATRNFDKVDESQHWNSPVTGDYMIWSQLLSGGNTLRKRFALALSEFFVVSLSGINLVWRGPAIGEYWDILNRNAFGNFRDLLEDITLNPAMGSFLNTRGNRRADTRNGRVPDENYAREIMQLFTIGLFELNPDGTQKLSGNSPIETYTNADVSGLARVFTGYDLDYADTTPTVAADGTRMIPDPAVVRRPMTSDPSRWQRPRADGWHSSEEKTFLGLTIPAGTGATESLKRALDHLFAHPNVGPFFARQMIQRLVTSNPSPAYVKRVADAFADNGQGRRGDLRATFKAILLDDEALNPANALNFNFGKLREPMLRFVQFARTFGAQSLSGDWQIGDLSNSSRFLGQSPLRSPSVFNFFRPAYFPAGSEIANRNLLAPEFQLVNETAVAGYVNFLERAVQGRIWPVADVSMNYAEEIAIAHDSTALLDRLDLLLTARQLSQGIRDTIKAAIDDVAVTTATADEDRLRRVQIAVMLVMVSTDYLIQK